MPCWFSLYPSTPFVSSLQILKCLFSNTSWGAVCRLDSAGVWITHRDMLQEVFSSGHIRPPHSCRCSPRIPAPRTRKCGLLSLLLPLLWRDEPHLCQGVLRARVSSCCSSLQQFSLLFLLFLPFSSSPLQLSLSFLLVLPHILLLPLLSLAFPWHHHCFLV